MNVQRWTLAVVSAATAMLMLDIAVVNTALSRIAEDLGTGLGGLQWVVDAYVLALASTVLTAGALADRLGRRRVFAFGMALFTISSFVAALSTDITMLNTARAVQGVGAAILFAVSLALLAHAYPGEKERNKALAVYGATIGASFAVGPLVGGALTTALDWQWVFLINIPIGIFSLWVTLTKVEESRDPNARKIDWPGQLTLAPALFLLVLGLTAVEAGLVYLPGTIATFIVSGATASMLEKVSPGLLISAGLALVAIGMSLVLLVDATSAWTAVLPGTMIAMVGVGMFNPAIIAVALGTVSEDKSGLAAGVNDTFRQAGIAVGVAGLGALIPAGAAFAPGGGPAYVAGLHDAMLAGAGLAAAGAVATAVLIGVRKSGRKDAAVVPGSPAPQPA